MIQQLDGDGLAAFNYNPLANTDDESCIAIVNGCIDNGVQIQQHLIIILMQIRMMVLVNDLVDDGTDLPLIIIHYKYR